jgi:hypothetical protein
MELEKKLATIEGKYQQIAEVLALKPTVNELEGAIARKLQTRAT